MINLSIVCPCMFGPVSTILCRFYFRLHSGALCSVLLVALSVSPWLSGLRLYLGKITVAVQLAGWNQLV